MDKDTFCENVRSWERSMYSLAYSVLKNDSDAGEAVSEAIYRAYRSLDSLKNEKAFRAWILRIVHNTCVEMIRKNSKTVPMEELPERADHGADNRIVTGIALRDAVNMLNQPYRTVVVLFYYENLSASKIGQITGTNPLTVKKQLSRARAMLREILKEDFANE